MSRWFRSYADTHRNPKVARLSDRDFRLWHNLLCIAAENDGVIPPAEDLKHMLRMRLDHCCALLNRLIEGSLIDQLEEGYEPRNWSERQYKSDTSTPRVQKHRAKCNVSRNVSVTPPDTETEAEKVPLDKESNGEIDPEKVLFEQGINLLAANGIPEKRARPWLGKLKRDYDPADVIRALGRAKREGALDIIPWVEAALRAKATTYDRDRITV